MHTLLSSQHKVRFQDCDPFNHLNNAKYIDYFINAREDQLIEHYNIDVFELAKTSGNNWVVASNQIAYKRPATAMEKIIIDSQLISYSSKNLVVELHMWDESHNKLKAILWVNFVYVNMVTKRATDHDLTLMDLFKQVCVPIDTHSFETRVQQFAR